MIILIEGAIVHYYEYLHSYIASQTTYRNTQKRYDNYSIDGAAYN